MTTAGPALLATALVLCAGAASSAEPAGGGEDCDGLFLAATTMDLEHAWSGNALLRQMEADCDSSQRRAAYWQLRAGSESLIGNHRNALTDYARMYPSPTGTRERVELPAGTSSKPALPYIVGRAASHRVVMVNERHHVATDRLLTLELLGPLYEQGFRYLAAEAVWEGEQGLNERGYPIRETGGYVNDVAFGELLRQAIALGYEVVPYEASREQSQATETMNGQQARDYWQAMNLVAATVERDPEARVLVHCGYAHLQETVSDRWTPMAHYLREATGLDPLTVDQTLFAERGPARTEHGWRIGAEERGLVDDRPVVLVDAAGELLRREDDSVDVRVLSPRTQYVNGRPVWMTMGGRRAPVTIDTPECVDDACVVAAFDVAWGERAVPYDRVEAAAEAVDLYLPEDAQVELRGYRLDGSPVFRRMLTPTR